MDKSITNRFAKIAFLHPPIKLESLTKIKKERWEEIKEGRSELSVSELESLMTAFPNLQAWLVFGDIPEMPPQSSFGEKPLQLKLPFPLK